MNLLDNLPRWIRVLWSILWSLRILIALTILGSVAVAEIARDYLDHRRERAAVMEEGLNSVRAAESKLVELLTQTDVLWLKGEPLPAELVKSLGDAATETLLTVSKVNLPNDNLTQKATDYQKAIAEFRNSIIRYQHTESTVRSLHNSINELDSRGARFRLATERQIENYNRSLLGLF